MSDRLQAITRWWRWTPEDIATWERYARAHPTEADAWVRTAAAEVARYKRLGIDSADELFDHDGGKR